MHANIKERILIAGGSLAGFMIGIELVQAGVDVQIYERSDRVLDDRGAGIVMRPVQALRLWNWRAGLIERGC